MTLARVVTRLTALLAALGIVLVGGAQLSPAQATATGKVMVNTQRMTGPGLPPTYTQDGWYTKGSTLTLSCYLRGQSVYGYFGGPDSIWYKVSDGRWVADIDIDTGSNDPITAACAGGNIIAPFKTGQKWYVCQGYNGSISHRGKPALDMTLNPGGVGSSGCTGPVNYSANQPVYSPVSGYLYQLSGGYGGVCINYGSKSIYLGHLINRRGTGSVSAGTQIGTVAPAGQAMNNGYAHVHLQAHNGTGCGSKPLIPFDSAHGLRFKNSPNLTYTGAINQWRGTAIYR